MVTVTAAAPSFEKEPMAGSPMTAGIAGWVAGTAAGVFEIKSSEKLTPVLANVTPPIKDQTSDSLVHASIATLSSWSWNAPDLRLLVGRRFSCAGRIPALGLAATLSFAAWTGAVGVRRTAARRRPLQLFTDSFAYSGRIQVSCLQSGMPQFETSNVRAAASSCTREVWGLFAQGSWFYADCPEAEPARHCTPKQKHARSGNAGVGPVGFRSEWLRQCRRSLPDGVVPGRRCVGDEALGPLGGSGRCYQLSHCPALTAMVISLAHCPGCTARQRPVSRKA
jgi:hypothetical protein